MSLLETCPVSCPYCGERNELVVETSLPLQDYIEDCMVCCRPMNVHVVVAGTGDVAVTVTADSE